MKKKFMKKLFSGVLLCGVLGSGILGAPIIKAAIISEPDGEEVYYLRDGDVLNLKIYLRGDVNCDGDVNAQDVLILSGYFAGSESRKAEIKSMETADINGDGMVSKKDNMILARHVIGWPGYANLDNFLQ